MRIAFAGNPNSGKTTMYNQLTGRNEKVGNWAGVTVDSKSAPIKKSYTGGLELIAVDLPGAYSMSPFTSEESITSAYVQNEHLDAIVNIVDATNLSRSLFFTTQLLELGIPVVVNNAINRSTEKGAISGHNIGLGNFKYVPTMQHGNIRLSVDATSAVASNTDEVYITINADFSMTILKDGADAFVLYSKETTSSSEIGD